MFPGKLSHASADTLFFTTPDSSSVAPLPWLNFEMCVFYTKLNELWNTEVEDEGHGLSIYECQYAPLMVASNFAHMVVGWV